MTAIALPASPLAIAGRTPADLEQQAVLNFLATYTGTTRSIDALPTPDVRIVIRCIP